MINNKTFLLFPVKVLILIMIASLIQNRNNIIELTNCLI